MDSNPSQFHLPHPSHRTKLWMLATVAIVTVALGVTGFFVIKTRDINDSKTQTTSKTSQAPVPGSSAATASQVSEEVKQLDLAEIKASVNEINSILKAF